MLALTIMCLYAQKNEKITLLFLCIKVVITGANQLFFYFQRFGILTMKPPQ